MATATGVSLRQIRGVLLHHARRLLHLGIRVDDDEPAHAVVLDDVDDALVGQIRHDQVGQGAQRGVGLERARELLADRGQQAERTAAAPLRVVDAGALERISALLAQRDRERPLLVVEDVPALEAEPECADRASLRRAAAPTRWAPRGRRSRGSGSRARPRSGRPARRARSPRRSACACVSGKRRQLPISVVREARASRPSRRPCRRRWAARPCPRRRRAGRVPRRASRRRRHRPSARARARP